MTLKRKKTARARLRRAIRRIRRSTVGVLFRRSTPALTFSTGIVLGFLLAATGLALRDRHLDWSFILVVITSIYVALTYLLLRTSVRQAAAAETNAKLFKHQLEEEQWRRVRPIDATLRDIEDRIRQWDGALETGDLQDLPELVPENFDQILQLSTTVNWFVYQKLGRMRRRLEDARSEVESIRQESSQKKRTRALANLKGDLQRERSSLRFIGSLIHDWDEEQ